MRWQDVWKSLRLQGKLQTGTRLSCLQQPVAVRCGCAVGRAASAVPSARGALGARCPRPLPTGLCSGGTARCTTPPAGTRRRARRSSLPPCRQSHGCVSPLQAPYLTARPSAQSRSEAEISLSSQRAAGTDAPVGCRAPGIHPHVSPESSARAAPRRLLRGRRDQPCSSHGDAP